MAIRGQRFTLDPDADNFTFNIEDSESKGYDQDGTSFVKEIREREVNGIPPPPKSKQSKTGFPQHRARNNASSFKQSQQRQPKASLDQNEISQSSHEPSDRAIIAQISKKHGINPDAKEKAEISDENKRRIAQMSVEDIEEARAEIMSSMSPAFIERLLKRANIDEDTTNQNWDQSLSGVTRADEASAEANDDETSVASAMRNKKPMIDERESHGAEQRQGNTTLDIEPQFQEVAPSIHFPVPPRNPDDYVALDPDSPSFMRDLKKHYFPDLPNDPSTLAWLQDPTEEESKASPYSPEQTRYAASDIRFGFTGRLIAPNESRGIPVSEGLHHHGQAPESAGYTIPELSILTRSVLPNQRCVAYQIMGRILYRLGRGDFGQRGSELVEGLWGCIEKERPIEVMMSEANRAGGHVSAKAYATEGLWLWRKGGGGDRGLLKPGERVAK